MMYEAFAADGYEYITKKIEDSVRSDTRTAVIEGKWRIDKAVTLPSNFTLILKDCHLVMEDGCFSNMFVNEHHGTELGRTVGGTDTNISIIGRGEAVIDGGAYNGLSESTQMKNGYPPIWKNNLILFTNVDGFKISNISCRNQRWWALNFIYCSNGYLGNIDFCANDTAVDESGNEYHGLKRARYGDVLVKNADGIDLRQGCHDILIENITGFTEDDTIALTGLDGNVEKAFSVDGLSGDICDIEIRNISTASYCTNVRLLNQGGIRLHDILIDGVYDTSATSPHMDRGLHAVRIGDPHLYGARNAFADETYNIKIRNVRGRGDYVLALAGGMSSVSMYGIESFGTAKMLLDERNK